MNDHPRCWCENYEGEDALCPIHGGERKLRLDEERIADEMEWQQLRGVTDEMIERACDAYEDESWEPRPSTQGMRAALEAVLSPGRHLRRKEAR